MEPIDGRKFDDDISVRKPAQSMEGSPIPKCTLRFVFGAKLIISGATNGGARVKIWIEASFFRLTLVTLLVTLQEQPSLTSPLGQNFDRLYHAWKRMQHLEVCLPTDLQTSNAHFSFHLSFKMIVFMYCLHKMKYNCGQVSFFSVFENWIVYLVFRRGKCRRESVQKCAKCPIFPACLAPISG